MGHTNNGSPNCLCQPFLKLYGQGGTAFHCMDSRKTAGICTLCMASSYYKKSYPPA